LAFVAASIPSRLFGHLGFETNSVMRSLLPPLHSRAVEIDALSEDASAVVTQQLTAVHTSAEGR
jgi:hypothetical protein